MGKFAVLLLAVWAAFLVACAADTGTVEVTRIVTEFQEIEVTREVEVTRIVETEVEKVVTRPVEVTRIVVATSAPKPTAEPTEVAAVYQWGSNYLGSGESAGVTVELARAVFTYKDNPFFGDAFEGGDDFNNVDTVGEFIIKVTNNADKAVLVNGWDDGFAQINDEQINFGSLDYRYTVLEEPIFPGASVIVIVWFPIRRANIENITTVSYHSGEIWEADTYKDLGPRISISAEITEYIWEPLPEEFKN